MNNIMALSLAVIIGALASLQSVINTELGKFTGGIGAALVSFTVGTATLGTFYLIFGEGGVRGVLKAPPYLWIGGVFGAIFVFSMIKLVPLIGASSTMAGVIAGQLLLALILDQFGLFGLEKIGLTWTRGLGAVLLMISVKLISK